MYVFHTLTSGDDNIVGSDDEDRADTFSNGQSGGNDTFDLGGGDDYIYDSAASVVFRGGVGNDTFGGVVARFHLSGDTGDDRLSVSLPLSRDDLTDITGNIISGGAGDDEIQISRFVAGRITPEYLSVDGGDGHDQLSLSGGKGDVIDISALTSLDSIEELGLFPSNAYSYASSTLNRFDNVVIYYTTYPAVYLADSGLLTSKQFTFVGSFSGATIHGRGAETNIDMHETNVAVSLYGRNDGSGSDRLSGGAFNDLLAGHRGDDLLEGGKGADRLIGVGGRDTASYLRAESGVTVNMGDMAQNEGEASGDTFVSIEDIVASHSNDTIIGNAASNRLNGAHGDDTLSGGAGNDLLKGSNGRDRLDGGAGSDRLDGGNNEDVLHGGDGDDVLIGGRGSDELRGGTGSDRYYGGIGADIYVFEGGPGVDFVMEFENGRDKFKIVGGADSYADLVITTIARDDDGIVDDVVVDYGTGGFVVMNTNLAQFDATDFLFAAA